MLDEAGPFAEFMEHVPAAFAVTRGAEHTLVYANAAFCQLTAVDAGQVTGRRIADAVAGGETRDLVAVLDRARHAGGIIRDCRIEPVSDGAPAWVCTVWPAASYGSEPGHLVIELRVTTEAETTLALQREVAERMLLSALRERDAANGAEASRRRATFLATEGRRFAESLDEDATLAAVAGTSLSNHDAWCVVDLLDSDGRMRRLAIVHPDPAKQAVAAELDGRWSPAPGDPFGVPAVLRDTRPSVITDDQIDAALDAAAHNPETVRAVRALGVGAMLTVPLVTRERLDGAITFIAGRRDHAYTPEEVALAQDLAIRSAMALDSARLHGEAIALRRRAEVADNAKGAFLTNMSHELRTPLNAIGGYVDLIDMGLRGPVTEAQHADLARIRANQRHLIGLVTDVLNFARVGSGLLHYDIADVAVREALATSLALVDALIVQKGLLLADVSCDASIVARGDAEKVAQILVNLLSNSIKFTPPGGRLAIGCEVAGEAVLLRLADTGIGIAPDKLAAIFEPFVQVRNGLAGRDTGVGLGLAISRDLARGMGGDLTVESRLGVGSTFTLSLPRASGGAPDTTTGRPPAAAVRDG